MFCENCDDQIHRDGESWVHEDDYALCGIDDDFEKVARPKNAA